MKIKFKGQEMEIPEGATFKVVGGDLIITPKKQQFKDGDIIYWEYKESKQNNGIAIFKSKDNKYINLYIDLLSVYGLIDDLPCVTKNKIISRLATEEEKQKLFYALEKSGKRWNPKTKQIEDILKVGDICIFWDNDKSRAIISTLLENHPENLFPNKTYKSSNCGWCWYAKAIKCTSLEQYRNFISNI